jgi:hypothetical protein
VRVGVGGGEELPVAAVGEARQPDLARFRAARRHLVDLGAQHEAAQALERVAPPGAVVDALAHGLAVLAVAGDVDARGLLPSHDLLDRRAQALLVSRLILRLTRLACPVELDQIVRARQAAGMTRDDALSAVFHRRLVLG